MSYRGGAQPYINLSLCFLLTMVRETCEIQRFKKLLEGAGEDFPLERICFQKAVRAVRRFWPELLLSSSVVVTLVDRVSVQLILQSEEFVDMVPVCQL
ncbi:hypothetical protein glysoja_014537 [Glycine soja]|nr:hypothetical protein glysoja_014537 [Glycine soja]